MEFDERMRVRVKQLFKLEEVLNAVGGKWPESEHTHAVRIEGIKAHYKTKPTNMRCAFEGRTHPPHFEGYVVETACGLLVNVGIDCAKRWIPTIGDAERAVINTFRYDRNIRTIQNDPLELQFALSALDKRIDSLHAAQQAIVAHLATTVSRRMRDAAENSRNRVVTVTSSHETGQGRRIFDTTYDLRGWELWNEVPTTLYAQTILGEIIEEIAEASATDSELNEQHEHLARRIVRFGGEKVRPIEEWADAAATFFVESNLRLIVKETKAPATVENGGLVVKDGGERVRIDVTGVMRGI